MARQWTLFGGYAYRWKERDDAVNDATVCAPEELKLWCDQASARQGASVASLKRANDREWRQ